MLEYCFGGSPDPRPWREPEPKEPEPKKKDDDKDDKKKDGDK